MDDTQAYIHMDCKGGNHVDRFIFVDNVSLITWHCDDFSFCKPRRQYYGMTIYQW